jgi:putative endonuclease
MNYVYVISNDSGQWYTGCTNDSKRRVGGHNSGKSTFTSYRGPYKLIYYETSVNEKNAYTREKYQKSGIGKRYIKNRLKNYLGEIV